MSGSGQAAAWAGTYPLEFLEPPDLGAASWHPFQLKIHPHGRFLFHGRLPGGARVAESGTLAISGAAVVHQGLHQGRGSLIGWLNVTHSVPPSADGTLLWSRTASTAHAGFNHQLVLAGLRTPSTNTNSAVELPLR